MLMENSQPPIYANKISCINECSLHLRTFALAFGAIKFLGQTGRVSKASELSQITGILDIRYSSYCIFLQF